MKQLQLQHQPGQHSFVLNLKLRHDASSPSKLFMPLGFPLSRSASSPNLWLSSQPFNKISTPSRLIRKMNRNSGYVNEIQSSPDSGPHKVYRLRSHARF